MRPEDWTPAEAERVAEWLNLHSGTSMRDTARYAIQQEKLQHYYNTHSGRVPEGLTQSQAASIRAMRLRDESLLRMSDMSNEFEDISSALEDRPRNTRRDSTNDNIKKTMKKRHLEKRERESLHRPLNDWKETSRGEVCINACSLPVDDIISKYKV